MSSTAVVDVDPLDHDLSRFGGRLAYARKRRGLAAAELERLADISKGMVGRYERGERGDNDSITNATVKALATALSVPKTWLADGDGGDPFRRPAKGSGSGSPAQAGA